MLALVRHACKLLRWKRIVKKQVARPLTLNQRFRRKKERRKNKAKNSGRENERGIRGGPEANPVEQCGGSGARRMGGGA